MTLNELIETLEDLLQEDPSLGDKEVNVAYQQNYPLAGYVENVTVINPDGDEDCTCEYLKDCTHQEEPKLWLALSDNQAEPYAPKQAWEQM
jgi:hypothetical protein